MRFRWIKTTLLVTALVLVPLSLSNSFALAISHGPLVDDKEKECEDECEDDRHDKKRSKKHSKKDKHKAKGKKHKEHHEQGQQRPNSQRPNSLPPSKGPNRGPHPDSSNHVLFSWQPENPIHALRGPVGPHSFVQPRPQRNESQPNHQAEMIELLSSINRTLKSIESMMREEKSHPKPSERGMSGPPMHHGSHGQGKPWQPGQTVPHNGPSDRGGVAPDRRGPEWIRSEERIFETRPDRERSPREGRGPERDDRDRGPRPDGPPRDGRGPDSRGPNRSIEPTPSPSDSPR